MKIISRAALAATVAAATVSVVSASSPALAARGGPNTNQSLPCAMEGDKASEVFDHPTTLRFQNDSSQQVNVYWLNYSGARVLYAVLAPGVGYDQGTFTSHPWVLTDAAGTCIQMHMPHGNYSVATVH